MSKILICLDPGHVYKYNVGAYKQYYEGTEMYNFSLLLKRELEKYDGIEAIITRANVNEYPSLSARAKFAKSHGAYLLLSLHSNGADAESAKYVAIYSSVAMAEKTNPLSKLMLDTVTDIMAADIPGVKSNGVSNLRNSNGGDYYGILRCATGGSVKQCMIIEHGFHSNYNTSKWLYNKDNQAKLAAAEAKTLANYYGCELKSDINVPIVHPDEKPVLPDAPKTADEYIVVKNDSWWRIASRELGDGSRYKELAAFNGMSSDTAIHPGDVIKIPGKNAPQSYRNYTVVPGDHLWKIACEQLGAGERYVDIAKASGISTGDVLCPGMILKIPTK